MQVCFLDLVDRIFGFLLIAVWALALSLRGATPRRDTSSILPTKTKTINWLCLNYSESFSILIEIVRIDHGWIIWEMLWYDCQYLCDVLLFCPICSAKVELNQATVSRNVMVFFRWWERDVWWVPRGVVEAQSGLGPRGRHSLSPSGRGQKWAHPGVGRSVDRRLLRQEQWASPSAFACFCFNCRLGYYI